MLRSTAQTRGRRGHIAQAAEYDWIIAACLLPSTGRHLADVAAPTPVLARAVRRVAA